MSMPHFTFHVRDLLINGTSALTESGLRTACVDVFNAWTKDRPRAESPSDQTQLLAKLEKKTEGQSAAEVWELTFRRAAPQPDSRNRFILRAHTGVDAAAVAEREQKIVRMLCGTGSDFFSSNLLEGFESSVIVAYRHVDDELGTASEPLKDILKRSLDIQDERFNDIIAGIETLAGGVTAAYRQIAGATRTISGAQYYHQIRNRLLPDLIVDARTADAPDRTLTVGESTIEISSNDGSMAPKNHDRLLLQDSTVFAKRVADGTLDPGWMRLKVWFVKRNHHIRSQFAFQSDGDGARIWLYADEENPTLNTLSTESPYTLLFNTRDPVVSTAFEQLRAAGFSGDSCLLSEEFEGFCDQIDRVHMVERHTDLHCGNILCGHDRPKIIDLVSVDRDLSPVSRARLEISIWYHVLGQIDITTDEIMQVLSAVENKNTGNTALGPTVKRLIALFAAIRSGFGDLAAPITEQEIELSLAYLTQVLLHQRYCVEPMHENAVALPFDTVARYWVERYRAAVSAPSAKSDHLMTPSEHLEPQEVPDETIGSLWALAVRNPRTDIVEAHSQRFLTSIASPDPALFNSQLTELQSDVLRRWPENRSFQSNDHIVLDRHHVENPHWRKCF